MTELHTKIKKMYLDGMSKNKIAKALDLTLPKVNYILYIKLRLQDTNRRKYSRPHIETKVPKPIINRIIVLTNFGYSAKEIAEDQRIPATRVHQVINYAKEKNFIQKKV